MLDSLRTADYDRYLSGLFAGSCARPHLFALYAFNYEVAKTWESVSQPIAGQIRLQWWRDAIAEIYEGRVRAHEVVQALAETIAAHDLPRALFDGLIDARENDLDEAPFTGLDALEAYCDATSGNPMRLALRILGAGDSLDEAARAAGIAYALTGLLRAVPFHASRGHMMVPEELLRGAGLSREDIFAGEGGARFSPVIAAIAERARTHLETICTRSIPRRYLPALLPAALVPLHLKTMTKPQFDPFRDPTDIPLHRRQWRMLRAMIGGRI